MKTGFVLLLATLASANVFLQNPRGSNNRWSSANDNVQNQNRLFRSANHPRGGYNYGEPMYYYSGSDLEIEWTMQHGCDVEGGNEDKTNCAIILQYMCSEWVRDGMTEQTISETTAEDMEDGMYVYGMHEDWDYYNGCQMRSRNQGLWIADRTIPQNGDTARYTRQNPGGARYGFECPEERDYYPYWHPTPWRDIAIYTNDEEGMCGYYLSNSQNQVAKSWCEDMSINNEQACAEDEWQTGMAHGIDEPVCEQIDYARANYLGNTLTGYPHRHTWTIPTVNDEIRDHCVLRIRYNITSNEVDWNYDHLDNEDDQPTGNTYWRAEGIISPVIRNPMVPMANNSVMDLNISYAVDTRSYGKTFEDRSHEFMIRERPTNIGDNKVYNLNVRGKRGNIVETFPATEYDFIPEDLTMFQYEYLHIQWTGTDENPGGAAGEGTDKTDRHNFVQTDTLAHHIPSTFPPENMMFSSQQEAVRMAFGGMTYQGTLCKSLGSLLSTNEDDDGVEEDTSNCMKMNLGSPYFDGGLQIMRKTGSFYYMSTRNNNYTNRSQKGVVHVLACVEGEPGHPDPCPKDQASLGPNSANVLVPAVAIAALLA